jgi:hypothetical protein
MDQIITYDVTEAAISKMKHDYMALTISGIDDKEGLEAVHKARMVVKGKRVEVDKKRKGLNSEALSWQKKVNAEAKRITALLLPIENHLRHEEDVVTAEKLLIREKKEKAEQERTQDRFDQLGKYECNLPFFEVAGMDDQEFNNTLITAKTVYEDILQKRAEEERIRKVKEEADRLYREAEAKKLADERERLDRIGKEQEGKEAAIKLEQERNDAAKKALEDEKRLAAAEQERENVEAAEKKRKEALRPDKEKLIYWIEGFSFSNYPAPSLENKEAQHILKHALEEIEIVLQETLKLAECLLGGHHDRP